MNESEPKLPLVLPPAFALIALGMSSLPPIGMLVGTIIFDGLFVAVAGIKWTRLRMTIYDWVLISVVCVLFNGLLLWEAFRGSWL